MMAPYHLRGVRECIQLQSTAYFLFKQELCIRIDKKFHLRMMQIQNTTLLTSSRFKSIVLVNINNYLLASSIIN